MASGFVMIEALFKRKLTKSNSRKESVEILFSILQMVREYLSNYKLSAIAQPGYVFSTWVEMIFLKIHC